MINKKKIIAFLVFSLVVLILLGLFRPTSILLEPNITPAEYLMDIPYRNISIFNIDFILIVPSSTIFIFILGIQTIVLGLTFLRNRRSEKSTWWGISMLFWGLGALFAGLSYQGLGYELKCAPYEFCIFTSWFELGYLYFTAISIAALAIAIAKTVLVKEKRRFLNLYALIALTIYTVLLLTGTIVESRFLISYELFTIFFMPLFVIFFVYSVIEYRKKRDRLNKTLIITWIMFLVVNLSYYVYYYLGIGESLYSNYSIWFSANDVLHVTLIFWMLFIQVKLKKEINNSN